MMGYGVSGGAAGQMSLRGVGGAPQGGGADDRAVGVDRRTSSIYGAFRPSDFRCLSVVFS